VVILHGVHLSAPDAFAPPETLPCASSSLQSTHAPCRQVPSQHSELFLQSVPASLQTSLEQKLSMQLPEQHAALSAQRSSIPLHVNEDWLSAPPAGAPPPPWLPPPWLPPPCAPPPGLVPLVWLVAFTFWREHIPFTHAPEQQFLVS